MREWLGQLARWGMTHATAVRLGALVLLVLGAVAAFPPRVDPNMLALVPHTVPAAKALDEMGADRLPSGIWLHASGAEAEVEALALALEARDEVDYVLWRLDPDLALHLALMQLDPEKLEDLGARLRLSFALGSAAASPAISQKLLGAVGAISAPDLALGPLAPSDADGHRLFVRPKLPHHDPAASLAVVNAVEAVIAAHAGAGVDGMAGPYVVVADGNRGIRADLGRTSGVSALLVLALLVVGLRSWRAPLVLFAPLVLAAVLQLAVVQALLGALSPYTVMGTAVLFGLGIDFGIHLLARVREARAAGEDEPVVIAWRSTGPAVVFAALTSAAGFSALGVARFQGLSQLAVAMSVGVLLALASVLVLLPALIGWTGLADQPPRRLAVASPSAGVARLGLVAIGVGAVLGLFSARSLRLEHDFTALGRDTLRFEQLGDQARELTRSAVPPALVAVTDATRATVQQKIRDHISAGDLPHVAGVLSMDDLLPPDQDRRVAALARLREQAMDPRVRRLPPPLVERLAKLREWTPVARTREDLPRGVRDLLGDGELLVLPLAGDLHDMRESAQLLDELQAHVPGAVSELALQGALYRLILDDLPRGALLALGLVALLALLDRRRPGRTLWVIASLGVGLAWALGVVAALGIKLTLVNLVGLPILLGLCVDVILHLAHRLDEGEPTEVVLATVLPASALSTATTVVSFLALLAASSGGLRSVGQLVCVALVVGTLIGAASRVFVGVGRR
ncbi:MAG: hypothetical protein EP330_03645 [Deltaproteobacteria bacterium]|nr:MAG: hypothetical protein EP330_03645 [Deltaproteobacteria bacterium]